MKTFYRKKLENIKPVYELLLFTKKLIKEAFGKNIENFLETIENLPIKHFSFLNLN